MARRELAVDGSVGARFHPAAERSSLGGGYRARVDDVSVGSAVIAARLRGAIAASRALRKAGAPLAIVAETLAVSCGRTPSDDFSRYVEQARKRGMSEEAESALRMVSGIRTGSVVVSFSKDAQTGTYNDNYRNTTCPNPRATAEERKRFQEEVEQRIARDVGVLRPHADLDDSGFVSADEAKTFADLWMFGFKAARLRELEGSSDENLARAMRLAPDEFRRRQEAYRRFEGRFRSLGESSAGGVEGR